MNKLTISKRINIKGQLLMIDKIIDNKKKKITAEYNTNNNSWFYKLHLTNRPIMPGILMEESMFQTASYFLNFRKKKEKKFFILIDTKSKFYGEISGKNKLCITTNLIKKEKKIYTFQSKIMIDKITKCKSEFKIYEKKKNY